MSSLSNDIAKPAVHIQILSDLHLEAQSAYFFDIPPSASHLALLGDIGNIKDDCFFDFLKRQLLRFRVVFFLFGNHEPYHSSWEEMKDRIRRFSEEMQADVSLGSLIVLDQTRYDLAADITVLGCTLHSKTLSEQAKSVSFAINDFYYIQDWSVESHNATHRSDLELLNAQVESISRLEP